MEKQLLTVALRALVLMPFLAAAACYDGPIECDNDKACPDELACIDGFCKNPKKDAGKTDAWSVDAVDDAHVADRAAPDSTNPDAGSDAGRPDVQGGSEAGQPDAQGPDDAYTADGFAADTTTPPDAGRPDTWQPDTWRPDHWRPDIGGIDLGPPGDSGITRAILYPSSGGHTSSQSYSARISIGSPQPSGSAASANYNVCLLPF